MIIRDAILGQRILVQININNTIIPKRIKNNSFDLAATVICRGKHTDVVMIGWKKDELLSDQALPINFGWQNCNVAQNISSYTHYQWVYEDFECDPLSEVPTLRSIPFAKPINTVINKMTLGHKCCKCSNGFPDAMHDNPKTFVCFECKLIDRMWRN